MSDSVPADCLSLCTGRAISSTQLARCLSYVDDIVGCLHQALGTTALRSTLCCMIGLCLQHHTVIMFIVSYASFNLS